MASVQVLPKVEHKYHHNITENNNIDLSLDAFDEKLSNVAKIEKALFALYQLLKECALIIQGELQSSQLNKTRTPSSYEHFTTKKPSMTELKPPSNLPPPRLSLRQYFYRLLVQLTSLAADLTAGSTEAHAAASVLLLNVLNALRHIKTAISGIVAVSKDDPVIVNFLTTAFPQVYFKVIELPTHIYLAYLLVITFAMQNIPSLLTGLGLTMFMTSAIIFLLPFIIMTLISIVIVTFSVAATSSMFSHSWDYTKDIIKERILTRSLLVSLAERIPPSIGRIEVTHEKQLKDSLEKAVNEATAAAIEAVADVSTDDNKESIVDTIQVPNGQA